MTLKWAAAVSRGIPRICRGKQRNLANGDAEFGKICRGKLWSLVIKMRLDSLIRLGVDHECDGQTGRTALATAQSNDGH